jgi:hypothetical protein
MIKLKSKTMDLALAMYAGTNFTARQIELIFGLQNPYRAVHYLRTSGVPVQSTLVYPGSKNPKWRNLVKYSVAPQRVKTV